MFAYCGNNPIVNIDQSGFFFGTIVGGLVGGLFGALDAIAEGKTGADLAASVLGGMASGATTGLAADILLVTGGTVGVVAGTMAVAGAVGAVASNVVEAAVLGESVDWQETVADAAWGAATGALFGYMGGEITSNLGKIGSKGFLKVAGDILLKENVMESAVEEVLTNMCDFVAGFTLDIIGKRISNAAK